MIDERQAQGRQNARPPTHTDFEDLIARQEHVFCLEITVDDISTEATAGVVFRLDDSMMTPMQVENKGGLTGRGCISAPLKAARANPRLVVGRQSCLCF